ncbi:MAG: AraC family transcriptional regulator [Roseiflexaceae bacterium]|nr:AraC family transcriptional regulator [Roseiflexaceae bacterium]
MDVLTEILDSLQLRSTVYCRAELHAPWSLQFAPTRAATFHVIDCGSCWLQIEGQEGATQLTGGDLIVLSHGAGHILSATPGAAPFTTIYLDRDIPATCEVRRSEGGGAFTTLLCGLFDFAHDNGHPLFTLLPPLIHIKGEQGRAIASLEATLTFLASEAGSGRAGTNTIVRRLADVLFIQVVRSWIESLTDQTGGWLGALRDPQIGYSLGMIHRFPDREWTVALLASEATMSRSAFAARFTTMVGEPPLQYLTRWRMRLAARLLGRNDLGLHEIAQRVGYESDVALSKAFKRETGVAPGAYRRQLATTAN